MSDPERDALTAVATASPESNPIEEASPAPLSPEEILVVRRGPGANCSSIGSALDMLYLSAVAAGAVLVGIAAALGERATTTNPSPSRTAGEKPTGERDAIEDADAGAR